MEKTTGEHDTTGIAERLVDTIQKYRKQIGLGVSILAGIIIVVAVTVVLIESNRKKNIEAVELLVEEYDQIRFEEDEEKKEAGIQALLDQLADYSDDNGYAGIRAAVMTGKIHADKKEWQEAEEAFIAAADKDPESYIAPTALYNAAASAEERGDLSKAIELYGRCAETYQDTFPLAPRAYFALGRLQEEQRDMEAALESYQTLVEKWPSDNWTKLAQSRIILIKAESN